MKRRPPTKTSLTKKKLCKELKAQYGHWGMIRSLFVPALAVSLWMAGGGVASAAGVIYIDVADNVLHKDDGAPGTVTQGTGEKIKTLTITGGNSWNEWNIYGGKGTSHNAIGYTLNLTNVLQNPQLGVTAYGGYAEGNDTKAEGNTVNIDNSSVNEVCGGWATTSDGVATGNTVNLTNANVTGMGVFGGRSQFGVAAGNTVNLINANVTGEEVCGGRSQRGSATGNTVTISRSTVKKDVYGGKSHTGEGDATHNIVTLTDATVTGAVYGGGFDKVQHPGAGVGKDYVSGNTLNLSGENNVGMIQNFQTINILGAEWGNPVLTLNGTGIVENVNGTKATIDASKLTFANPETIKHNDSTPLITCGNNATITANLVNTTATQTYTVAPIAGVTVNAALNGTLALTNTALTYTATNKASKLTFGDVEWKDSGALLDHKTTLSNISFNGADVDTTKIHFTNIESLAANKKMTLVSSFGDTVGTITGEKYTVGTTLEGKGKASLSGKDLIFTAETGTGGGLVTQEQTHNTVMGAEVSMTALSAGNDFIGTATEGLSLASNVGADGVSSFAQMGGGSMRQETGSHIDTHTWNAILALGHQNKKERGTTEYGAFFEYGTGNYTTQSDDGRGDGSSRYTGGGVLGKYTLANGVYVEGSLRAGTVHDDARDVLHDANGIGYSYDTSANYLGAHIGFGKEIEVAGGNVVDVYGKYFYNRRNSVSFDVAIGDHYDLDAVTSQIVRVGARYTMRRDKWNFYGGVAYEHELDGVANGTAGNGGVSAPIQGADVKGASFRGEIGATMKPGENSPWSLDLNVAGFAGKKQGFTGGVSVAFMF